MRVAMNRLQQYLCRRAVPSKWQLPASILSPVTQPLCLVSRVAALASDTSAAQPHRGRRKGSLKSMQAPAPSDSAKREPPSPLVESGSPQKRQRRNSDGASPSKTTADEQVATQEAAADKAVPALAPGAPSAAGTARPQQLNLSAAPTQTAEATPSTPSTRSTPQSATAATLSTPQSATVASDAGGEDGSKPSNRKQRLMAKQQLKANPLMREVIIGIPMAAKTNDIAKAADIFRQAEEAELMLPLQPYNSLLYMSMGGDQWEVLVRGGDPHRAAVRNISEAAEPTAVSYTADTSAALQAAMPLADRIQLAERVWTSLQASGSKPDSASFVAMARWCALQHKPNEALEWIHKCKAAGHQVGLRLFHPAMVGYCMQHNTAALEALDKLIAENELDLTEYEFARLIEGYAADRQGAWTQLKCVLDRMTKELEQLEQTTLDLVSAYFHSPQARHALPVAQTQPAEGTGSGWQMQRVQVDTQGYNEARGARLQVVDLEDAEWESFAEGVASLARRSEAGKSNFDNYIEWFERNGPFDILIDGANVAYFGQNRAGGGFNWGQIQRMVQKVRTAHPGSKVLLMLHKRRTQDREAQMPSVQQFLEKLTKENAFYHTPPGSNDDWYWLYATVRARQKGLLVSNDELRDHIFSLLRPKHFLKWKARHIAHYSFPGPDTDPELIYPPAFTSCVQQMENGAWMFPAQDGSWLCVRPAAQPGA